MPHPLSLTGRHWILRDERIPTNPREIYTLLASKRGLSPENIQTLSDPYLFPEMEKAVARIEVAMMSRETIAIFGDYDADGITAAVQLVRFFRRHGVEPIVYLPDRLQEGYGMKKKSIDDLKAKGVSLLITVDTGIAATAEILHASSLGIDTIVTDHHRAPLGRPPAFAVIHPMIPAEFPNPHLSGSGVAFMLLRALEHGQIWEGIAQDIVLAMIGTVGDVMPLTGENRILVMHGLQFIEKLPDCPLRELIEDVTNGKSITSGDIAFRVVPRINAAGRMEHPALALKALLEGGEALEVLHRLNGDRQLAIEEALAMVAPLVDRSQPFLSLLSEDVTAGIVGLIAGRLTEESGRPSLVAAKNGTLCTASIRSIPKIDVMECLTHPAVQPLLKTFGGHAQAAGCTFDAADFPALQKALSQAVLDLGFTTEALLPEILIEHELPHGHLSLSLVKDLLSLEPFGQGNEEPLFLLRGLTIGNVKSVGAEGLHLQISFGAHRAIAFRFGPLSDQLVSGTIVDVACSLGLNAWNGKESLQLVVKDIRMGT